MEQETFYGWIVTGFGLLGWGMFAREKSINEKLRKQIKDLNDKIDKMEQVHEEKMKIVIHEIAKAVQNEKLPEIIEGKLEKYFPGKKEDSHAD